MRDDSSARNTARRAFSRALLVLAGTGAALLVLEVALRLYPMTDRPVNDPYQFTGLVGTRQFRVPFHSYRETYPLEFDHDGYYGRSGGAIDYHFDQAGGRWSEPRARDLQGRVGIVVGDSFTLGFGLRYEDAYIFLAEQALQQEGDRRHLINFSEPGAEARISLRNYLAVGDTLAHDLVLYGLHLNDLISFPTSYVVTDTAARAPAAWRWRLGGFVARTLEKRRERAERIRHLTDPAQLNLPRFTDNMAAIESLQRESTSRGARFYVVILPILVDLRAGTFDPVYAAIRQALQQRGVSYVDLTDSLDGGSDSAYWILPFDQHPNERANAAFARRLTEALRQADGIDE